MRGADCWTDHILLRCRVAFQLTRKHRRQAGIKRKLDVQKLSNPFTHEILSRALSDSLPVAGEDNTDIEITWTTFKNSSTQHRHEYPWSLEKNHQDWFDHYNLEIKQLPKEKRDADNDWLSYNCVPPKTSVLRRCGERSRHKRDR